MSFDIRLPKDHPARFPDRCIRCGNFSPGSTVTLTTGAPGWWPSLSIFVNPFVVRPPACPLCAWRLHGHRIGRLLATVAVFLLAWYTLWPWLADSVPAGAKKWVVLALAVPLLAVLSRIEKQWPPPFDMTTLVHGVEYEFLDPDLALDFATLNRDADWIENNGVRLDRQALEDSAPRAPTAR